MLKKVVEKKRWLNVLLAALLIAFLLEGAIFSLTPPHLTISRPEDALVLEYNLPALYCVSQPNIKPTAAPFSRDGCRYFTLFFRTAF